MSSELALRQRTAWLSTLAFSALVSALALSQPAAAQDGAATASASASLTDIETDTSDKAEAPKPEAGATDSNAEPNAEPDAEQPWDILHRRYNGWNGPTGGLFLTDASTGEVGAVRLALGLDLFSGDDFLVDGDHVEQDRQTFSFSWTATKLFEIYATLANRSTATSRPGAQSLSTTGDLGLGGKVGGKVAPLLYFAGDLRALFANQVGGGGMSLEGTSLGLQSELSAHFEELAEPVPLIARLNIGYLFDNTGKLIADLEDTRYKHLNGATAKQDDETRHLINRFERLAMGVNRLDRFSFGLGVELPLEVTERFYLHPLLEWRLDVPVNRQGYDCPFVAANKKAGTIDSPEDSCYERTSGDTFPMNLALGVRVVPPVRGVSAILGLDLGLVGTDKFVRDLSPNAPYRLMLALAYDYDARPLPKPPEPPKVEPPAPPPPEGRIQGAVTSSEGGPVASAIVTFLEHDVSAVASSSDGHFTSQAFAPGEVRMEVSHPDYEASQCAAQIPEAGGNVEAQCTLTPAAQGSTLRARVLDLWGSPVAGARVELSGASSTSATSDARGEFEAANLAAGEYTVKAQADGYFLRLTKTTVEARTTGHFEITLMPKPVEPTVSLRGQTLVAKNVKFVGTSTDLDDAALASVAEIADLMLTRTDLSLRIQGYGGDAVALSRALLIKQRLVDAGVPDSRVEAVGGTGGRVVFTVSP